MLKTGHIQLNTGGIVVKKQGFYSTFSKPFKDIPFNCNQTQTV